MKDITKSKSWVDYLIEGSDILFQIETDPLLEVPKSILYYTVNTFNGDCHYSIEENDIDITIMNPDGIIHLASIFHF